MAAEVVGSVVERDLLDALFTGRAQLVGPARASTCRRRCRPSARASRSTRRCRAFAEADAALVLVDGKPAGVVTRQDVLGFLGA